MKEATIEMIKEEVEIQNNKERNNRHVLHTPK